MKVVGNGSNKTRLTRPRRTVKKITTFPCTTSASIKVTTINKRIKVGDEELLESLVKGKGVKSGRMTERNRSPSGAGGGAGVSEKTALARGVGEHFGDGGDMGDVRKEKRMTFRKTEREGATLVERVVESVGVVSPDKTVAGEDVFNGVVG